MHNRECAEQLPLHLLVNLALCLPPCLQSLPTDAHREEGLCPHPTWLAIQTLSRSAVECASLPSIAHSAGILMGPMQVL